MSSAASMLVCMAVCLPILIWIFMHSSSNEDVTPAKPALLTDREDGYFHCPHCAKIGQAATFDRAGDLMVHEFQSHPIGQS